MKKRLIACIVAIIVVFLSIFISSTDTPKKSNIPASSLTPVLSESRHASEQLTDGLFIDANIPLALEDCFSYTLEKLDLDAETAKHVFFNGNRSVSMVYTDTQGNAYENGDYAIYGENGERLTKSRSSISYVNAKYQQHLEIEDLLLRYVEKHPEGKAHSLSFMSKEDALAYGLSIIQAIGIPFTPVEDIFIGLEHDKIIAWQQELLNDENSHYDIFDKAIILSNLDEHDDVYYLRFSFDYVGIPIFGTNSPNISFADAVLPPAAVYAKMLITANGIEYFDLYPAYTVTGTKECSSVISPEAAIAKVKEKYESTITFGNSKIVSICMEYIPFETVGQTVLRPYWCLSISSEKTGDDGRPYWSDYLSAERINAFTGEDLAYGG